MADIKLSSAVKVAMIACFMLFAIDALGIGWYIFGIASALMFLYLLIKREDLKLDSLFIWVALLAMSNYIIMFGYSNAGVIAKTIKYLVSPICAYLLGTLLASDRKKNDSIVKLYMIGLLPYFMHGVLDLIKFDGFSGYEREIADFWTGEMWKATLVCTFFAMTVPLLFISFITKGIYKKIAYALFTVVAVYACIITASRTVIYIGIVVLLFQLILYLRECVKNKDMRAVRVVLGILVFTGVVGVIIALNMGALSQTLFFKRLFDSDMSDEPRIQLFLNIILNAWKYPFGNMPYFYSHNTWLDFLRESGWITFFCFCVITVIAAKHVKRIYTDKALKYEHRLAVVAMMSALYLDMFVEPIMDGAAMLFCLFFYFIGINSQFANEKKRGELDV